MMVFIINFAVSNISANCDCIVFQKESEVGQIGCGT